MWNRDGFDASVFKQSFDGLCEVIGAIGKCILEPAVLGLVHGSQCLVDPELYVLWGSERLPGALELIEDIHTIDANNHINVRFQRLFAVCLMAVAIFPSISDSDDLFHFSLLQVPTPQTGGFGNAPQDERQEKGNLQLARLLETLEHFQISGFYLFLFTLASIAVSQTLRVATSSRHGNCYAGRAPPLT